MTVTYVCTTCFSKFGNPDDCAACDHSVASSGNSDLLLRDERGMKKCPCGKHPTELVVVDAGQGSKWAFVYGDCCGEWHIEFRTMYHDLDSNECMALALDAWNEAPRQAQ